MRLRETILASYDGLLPSERKLADVVMQRRSDLAAYTATELAALAGVSKATAARFFRRLGYENFNRFREEIRANPPAESPLFRLEGSPKLDGGLSALERHVSNDAKNLAETLRDLAADDVRAAIRVLKQAQRVWVVGFRNGYATAFYAQALFSHAKPNVHLLNNSASKIADVLGDVGAKDALFVVDFRRRLRLLGQIVSVARQAGARIVLLTDSPVSERARHADVILGCTTRGSALFDSYVAPMSIVNFLGASLAAEVRPRARERMQRIEQIHDFLSDLED
ncbi:MAG TPA: MurR/RpiR family transcriptional regulator [Zeimonas sp.]|nr:MurR/RpiR family transcriptional regulator [Zeimonas sp.]